MRVWWLGLSARGRLGSRPPAAGSASSAPRQSAGVPALAAVTAVIYLFDAVALLCGRFLRTPGTNPAAILGLLALAALGLAAYAVARGHRFTQGEATAMLAVQLGVVVGMSHTTRLDVAALGNGFGLSMLGAYASWLLARPAAVVLHAGMSLWVGVIALRGGVYLTAAAVLCAVQAAVVTEVVRILRRRVRELTEFDLLTGVLNRRGVEQAVALLRARSARNRTPLCVGLIDLDDLRQVNNTLGHLAGDGLLVAAATEWRRSLHEEPVVAGRIGGDEFVLLFDGLDEAGARHLLVSLRTASTVRWTAGLAQMRPGETFDEVLARADAEMYENKAAKPPPSQGGLEAR